MPSALTQEQCTRIWQAISGILGALMAASLTLAVWTIESKSVLQQDMETRIVKLENIGISPEQHQKLVDQCQQNSRDIETIRAHQVDVMAEQQEHEERLRQLEKQVEDNTRWRYQKESPQQ